MTEVAGHWALRTDLPKEPLQAFGSQPHIRWTKASVWILLAEIQHDGSTLHQGHRLATWPIEVHGRGDLRVRARAHEARGELFAFSNVDHVRIIGNAKLLQENSHLPAVGRRQRIQLKRCFAPRQWGLASRSSCGSVDARETVAVSRLV
eukprot:CAMPEP_0177302072 /NCGR_PEP_ID=MMETSP0368-20130122/5391_1 /TAXON_ID=447022 ORGANISM="Scrippsiella hangoei-like, Strain SHHI-4" /NCGR_SAMPLE_ID=MMETSP0368 /ASSEMBLY_ACC=CAM_ASM_000363 /LENGTH=148 /DNA_ID=CAMNT_0018760501 /DNA_START=132 /DNA_END=578 /DNA_ORIENTATION=-